MLAMAVLIYLIIKLIHESVLDITLIKNNCKNIFQFWFIMLRENHNITII